METKNTQEPTAKYQVGDRLVYNFILPKDGAYAAEDIFTVTEVSFFKGMAKYQMDTAKGPRVMYESAVLRELKQI